MMEIQADLWLWSSFGVLLKRFFLDSTDEFNLNATAEHVNTSRCFEALYRGKDGWKYSYRTEPEKQWFLCPPHGTRFIKSVWKQWHSDKDIW